MLTVTIDGLSPPGCEIGSSNCANPSGLQYGVLFAALALLSVGVGGSRYILATMGANQFTKLEQQSTYFNWYFSALYSSLFISATAIVYIEDNVSWAWGLGICIAAHVLALALFLVGRSFYHQEKKPQGSPVTSLFCVIVASVRKRNAAIPPDQGVHHYYYGDNEIKGRIPEAPTTSFR